MAVPSKSDDLDRVRALASNQRDADEDFSAWAKGYGVIRHEDQTQVRMHTMVDLLCKRGTVPDRKTAYRVLAAVDKVTSAAMWLVVHMTYAQNMHLDGRALGPADFKEHPEGHTGGSLNMVPAYAGYLAINALTGMTRSWLMGQGHCVAAIDATNLVVDNMSPEQVIRYAFSDDGLQRFVQDFYSCEILADGTPGSPLGSHVNPSTAGGLIEGGYLGFAELLYAHVPLPGEHLVAFLSDGAFEEQRGSDWAARWWRAEDSGSVAPIMIANGRRIDQRTTMAQSGGIDWFRQHLKLNGFDPIEIDGRDPAAFAWAIFEIEERLTKHATAIASGKQDYPVPLPYAIAETVKGFGFPGAGTNRAHNLPLLGNPHFDDDARAEFNTGAGKLWVPPPELKEAISAFATHAVQGRPKERDNPIVTRRVPSPDLPEPPWKDIVGHAPESAMAGLDQYFSDIVTANPNLRPRVGNPDEMRSNRMNKTLDLLKHRVTAPEDGLAESTSGCVVTALNEEAVVCAALGNKGGINLVVSYEAFAVKMLGAIRQSLIFARHQIEKDIDPEWLGVPIVLTSHVWENGKNEQSHQDPTLCEALMGEMSDVSRVVFPPDWNGTIATLREVYRTRGCLWSLVVPKRPVAHVMTQEQSEALVANGAVRLGGTGAADEKTLLIAIGAYQLAEAFRASGRLEERGVPHGLVYVWWVRTLSKVCSRRLHRFAFSCATCGRTPWSARFAR
jgi:phosphoketolase